MASTKQTTMDEQLGEARTTMVERKAKFDRAFFAFEMFQVFLLLLALICGYWSCTAIIEATDKAANFEPKEARYFNVTVSCQEGDEACYQKFRTDCNRCIDENIRNDCPCDIGYIPKGGDMINRNGGGCQVHFRLAEALGLTPAEFTLVNGSADAGFHSSGNVGKIGFGDKASAAVNKALFGDSKKDVTIACPIDLGDDADCSLAESHWESYKHRDEEWEHAGPWQQSMDLYERILFMLPIWVILKMLSLDGELIDMFLRKITCGLIKDNQGRLDDLMLDFDVLKRCPGAQFVCKNTVKFFRFKLASNVLIWPLTTIGFSSKCGEHLYTKMPHPVIVELASVLVLLDGGYLLMYYLAMSCCEKIKTYRVLYLPCLAATAMSVVLQVYAVAFTGSFSFILGWNFSLAFNFTMSFSFNAFRVIFSILSVLEQLSLFVTVGKEIRKQNVEKRMDQINQSMDRAQDVASKVQTAGVKGANLLESKAKVLGARKDTEIDQIEVDVESPCPPTVAQ